MLLRSTYLTCPLLPEIQDTNAPTWNPVCKITYNRDSWVKLLQLPNEYSFDEALLLCQESQDTWIAWVPSHGEILLNRSDFYC
jgi:hypothetical protein